MKAPDGIRTRYPTTYQVGIQPDELQVPAFVFGADGVLSTPLPSETGTCNITPSPHLILSHHGCSNNRTHDEVYFEVAFFSTLLGPETWSERRDSNPQGLRICLEGRTLTIRDTLAKLY